MIYGIYKDIMKYLSILRIENDLLLLQNMNHAKCTILLNRRSDKPPSKSMKRKKLVRNNKIDSILLIYGKK